MKLSEIRLNPDNPRFIRDDRFQKLKDNIKAFPKMMKLRPIVIDDSGIILGGNMRYRALTELGYNDLPDGWVVKASELTKDEKRRFIITDNIGYGEFDMDLLANEWDLEELQEWGVELGELVNPDELGDEFSLPDGDKPPFQQMTFTLADEQAELIKRNLAIAKKDIECATYDNDNSNGNALYRMVKEWGEQKI